MRGCENVFDRRTRLRILGGIVLLAALIRLSLLLGNGLDSIVFSGEANYARIGQNLVTGAGYRNMVGEFDLFKPPLFPLAVGALYQIVGDLALSGHIVSMAFGLALVPLTYTVGTRLFDGRVGLVTSAFVAVFPQFVRASTVVRSEAMYTTMLLVAAYAGYRTVKEPSLKRHLLVGLLFGLCYLIRPQAVGYIVFGPVVTGIAVLVDQRGRPLRSRLEHLLRVGVQPVAFFLVSSPYLYYLYDQTGRFTFGTKASKNLIQGELRAGSSGTGLAHERLIASLVDGTNVTTGQYLVEHGPSVLEYVTSNPVSMGQRYLLNLGELYYSVIPRLLPFAIFALIGVAIFLRREPSPEFGWRGYLYGLVLFYPLAVLPLFYVTPRFLVPLVPFVLLVVAAGTLKAAAVIYERVGGADERVTRSRITIVAVGLVVLLLIPQLLTYYPVFPGSYTASPEHKAAGEWLEGNSNPEAVVMERNSIVSFYGGRESRRVPYENFSRVMTYAGNRSVDYFVVSERYMAPRRPQLQFLLNTSRAPANLTAVYVRDEPQKIVIYTVDSEGAG